MITRIVFENFLSLKDCTLELKNFNVLIGPNSGGKSNFIKGIELIKNFVTYGPSGIRQTFSNLKFEDIVFGKEGDYFSISIESGEVVYSVRFSLDSIEEKLLHKGTVIFSRKSTPTGERIEPKQQFYPTPTKYFDAQIYFSFPLEKLAHSLPDNARTFVEYLSRMNIFSFLPESIRASSSVTSSPVLTKYGGNLARVLLHLYLEEREAFQEIEELVGTMIPDVKEIVPRLKEDIVYIGIKDRNLGKILEPQLISDGTLRILALITSVAISKSLVAYEEPENFVHPKLLQSVVSLLKRSERQVVITTHSPYLLDHVEPDDVVLVWKEDGETRLLRLSNSKQINAVKKFLEEGGTLGEAWYSGILGEQV